MVFTVRADDHGGKRRIRLEGTEFVRRFLLHVLPTGIKRIRHYGVLASACKGIKLSAARLALRMPAVNPLAAESAHAFMVRVARMDVLSCPCCKVGRLHGIASGSGSAVTSWLGNHRFVVRLRVLGAALCAALACRRTVDQQHLGIAKSNDVYGACRRWRVLICAHPRS